MEVEERFVQLTGLICEPTRATMLWQLMDNKAHTASELAVAADISPTSASNHLAKLLEADIIKVEMQGRHRYYSFSNHDVAYAVEALAHLANVQSPGKSVQLILPTGIKYCRSCYDHLAGFVGVSITEAMEKKGYLEKSGLQYHITGKGWKWLSLLELSTDDFMNNRRPVARQCLDWTERRPHLAGQLGAVLLNKMLEKKWFKRVQFSRELIVTAKGREGISERLGLIIQ